MSTFVVKSAICRHHYFVHRCSSWLFDTKKTQHGYKW